MTDIFSKILHKDEKQAKVSKWLSAHSKADFHECSWIEIAEAYRYAGVDSPLITYLLGAKTNDTG